jgi:hypothetical protein
MKTILTFAFVAFLAITTSAVATDVHPSYTQTTASSCFSNFRVHRQQNGAALMWSVNTDISQFKIERSFDGDFFEDVTVVPGNGAAQHRYTDRDIFPGYVYYRITALKTDGTTEQSAVEMVRIVSRK